MCAMSSAARQGKRKGVFPAGAVFIVMALLVMAALVLAFECSSYGADYGVNAASANVYHLFYLRIYDWKTGELRVSEPVKVGSEIFFGWIHSLEKIPWNEYYHVDENLRLILDAITFPAFGAGIPENKGLICYVKDGLIHM